MPRVQLIPSLKNVCMGCPGMSRLLLWSLSQARLGSVAVSQSTLPWLPGSSGVCGRAEQRVADARTFVLRLCLNKLAGSFFLLSPPFWFCVAREWLADQKLSRCGLTTCTGESGGQ